MDEGTGDALVVENNNYPRDALAQLADLVRLDQLQMCLFHRNHVVVHNGKIYPKRYNKLGGNQRIILTRIDLY